MVNKYVNFVSDKDFLECVKSVLIAYVEKIDLQKNVIDPFKIIFDSISKEISEEEWLENEEIRQKDKTINNKIGEFHQKLLGKSKGWVNLGVGDLTKVDLKKSDNSIFLELKNKHNTVNGDSKKKCKDKLIDLRNKYPNSTCYFSYIIPLNGKSEDKIWASRGETNPDNKLRVLTGKKIYELITGDGENLIKVFKALPNAIKDILEFDEISSDKINKFKKYIEYSFRKS